MTTNDVNTVDQLFNSFKQQAEALSASVYRVDDIDGAGRQINEIIKEKGAEEVAAAHSDLVKNCLTKIDTSKIFIYTEELQNHAKDAGIGISEVGMAIAETGSLVQDASDLNQRLVSTLPPVHIALVPVNGLINTFIEAIEHFNNKKNEMPDYISFISGPSRTADIERVLTIGVHGPEELHIIFVDKVDGGGAVE